MSSAASHSTARALAGSPRHGVGASTVVSIVPHNELDALLAEQTAYYRAQAGEYDKTSAFDADPAPMQRQAAS